LETEGWYNVTVFITDNETQSSSSDEVLVLVDRTLESGVQRTYYINTNSYDEYISGFSSGWTCVFDPFGINPFIFPILVESGEIVHLTFEGYFSGGASQSYDFAFHEVIASTLVKQGLLNEYILGSSFTTVHMERIFVGLSPGVHYFTMAIQMANCMFLGLKPRFMMAQTIIP